MDIAVVVLLMGAVASAQPALTLQYSNDSITNIVHNVYQPKAARYWAGPNGVYEFLDLVNTARAAAALNVSMLFIQPTDAALVYNLVSNPPCAIKASVNDYIHNETSAQEFICCHLQSLSAPGLDDLMVQISQYILSQTSTASVAPRVLDYIANVQLLRDTEFLSITAGICKDDLRIHNPESQTVRAEMIGQILGGILRTYRYVAARAVSLQGCLGNPTIATGCIFNAPIPFFALTPNFAFSSYDPYYQSICGLPALVAFEQYRAAPGYCL